jgi:hypothetical protein
MMLLGASQWLWIPLPGAAEATTRSENKSPIVSIGDAFTDFVRLQCPAFTDRQS